MKKAFIDKSSARAYFSSLRASLDETERKNKSVTICSAISDTPEFTSCDTLLVYYPIKNEVSPLPLAEKALSLGKRVAFPISLKSNLELDFREVLSLNDLSVGAYGIREPSASAQRVTITDKTLCIVPALAFDISGNRLGYGKGYYDRFLQGFAGTSIGITFNELLCDSLPTQSTDIPVNLIITDTGSVKTK